MTSRRAYAWRALRILVGLALLVGLVAIGFGVARQLRTSDEAGDVAGALEQLIPGDRRNANLARSGNAKDNAVISVDGRDYIGLVSIPSLDVTLPVASSWDTSAEVPGVYAGQLDNGDLVVGGPNEQDQFGKLTDTADGDRILITDVQGRVFTFEVATIETVDADDMASITQKLEPWDLTLFTATYSGQEYRVLRGTAVTVVTEN